MNFNYLTIILLINIFKLIKMGIGDWGLGPIPNPH